MGKGGQIYGNGEKLDFCDEQETEYQKQIIMLHT